MGLTVGHFPRAVKNAIRSALRDPELGQVRVNRTLLSMIPSAMA